MVKINLQLFAGEVGGNINVVYVLAGTTAMAAGTGAQILGVDNSSYDRLCALLDTTSFGDAAKKRLAGLLDTSVKISGNVYVGDTTGQDVLVPGNTIFIGVFPSGRLVASMQVKAIVESFSIKSDANGKQTFDCSIQGIAVPVTLPARLS